MSDSKRPPTADTAAISAGDEESVPMKLSSGADYKSFGVSGSPSVRDFDSSRTSSLAPGALLSEGRSLSSFVVGFLRTLPAVLLLASLNLMMAVPFGSTYLSPVIPLDETSRQGMGMRLSLLALAVGQFVLGGFGSDIDSATPWQLGELSPFYHTLADIAAKGANGLGDGGGDYILPTTLYLMSASTVLVGLSFYAFGRLGFAEVTYFFPTYVMLGLIGGVGIWMMTLTLSISTSPSRYPGALHALVQGPFLVTVAFTAGLRLLRRVAGHGLLIFLDPVYFLSIPLVFYGVLWVLGWSYEDAAEDGYLFKDPDVLNEGSVVDANSTSPWAIWKAFDPTKVMWGTIFPAAPTLFAASILAIIITAPFIPPLALLKGEEDFDMNREFRGHGIANFLSGIVSPGGLAVCMSYSTSSVYTRAGGAGKLASTCLACMNFVTFMFGSQFVEYIPRCMAGALILDMGVNLFLEGILDPDKKCDPVEYASIWIIIVTMTAFDMTAGLVAGLATALVTHTLQSNMGQDPVRTARDASTLYSSRWRSPTALGILDDPARGRSQIVIFLLQGHLFFGNISKLRKRMFSYLEKKRSLGGETVFVVLDFTLVVGIDSSAMAFINKIRTQIRKKFGVSTTVFVSGPRLPSNATSGSNHTMAHVETPPSQVFFEEDDDEDEDGETRFRPLKDGTFSLMKREQYDAPEPVSFDGTFFGTLDEALSNFEDLLIARQKPGLEKEHADKFLPPNLLGVTGDSKEEHVVIRMLREHCRVEDGQVLRKIFNALARSVHQKGQILWNLGDDSTSAKLLLQGSVFAFIDECDPMQFRATIKSGAFIGLRGLILSEKHRATVRCECKCVVYSLDLTEYNSLAEAAPRAALALNQAVAWDLSHRLQHISMTSFPKG